MEALVILVVWLLLIIGVALVTVGLFFINPIWSIWLGVTFTIVITITVVVKIYEIKHNK